MAKLTIKRTVYQMGPFIGDIIGSIEQLGRLRKLFNDNSWLIRIGAKAISIWQEDGDMGCKFSLLINGKLFKGMSSGWDNWIEENPKAELPSLGEEELDLIYNFIEGQILDYENEEPFTIRPSTIEGKFKQIKSIIT